MKLATPSRGEKKQAFFGHAGPFAGAAAGRVITRAVDEVAASFSAHRASQKLGKPRVNAETPAVFTRAAGEPTTFLVAVLHLSMLTPVRELLDGKARTGGSAVGV